MQAFIHASCMLTCLADLDPLMLILEGLVELFPRRHFQCFASMFNTKLQTIIAPFYMFYILIIIHIKSHFSCYTKNI